MAVMEAVADPIIAIIGRKARVGLPCPPAHMGAVTELEAAVVPEAEAANMGEKEGIPTPSQ